MATSFGDPELPPRPPARHRIAPAALRLFAARCRWRKCSVMPRICGSRTQGRGSFTMHFFALRRDTGFDLRRKSSPKRPEKRRSSGAEVAGLL